MERSNEIGFVDDEALRLRQGLIKYRNSLVHNDGFASETDQHAYPSVTLNATGGVMARGATREFAARFRGAPHAWHGAAGAWRLTVRPGGFPGRKPGHPGFALPFSSIRHGNAVFDQPVDHGAECVGVA